MLTYFKIYLLSNSLVMSLFTISTQFLRRGLLLPRKRILFNYLIAMVTVFGVSGTSLYLFVIKSLNQQLNQELLALVEAATPSLSVVKNGGKQDLERELSWNDLFSEQHYGIEWYDPQGNLLAKEGSNLTQLPLFKGISPEKLNSRTPIFKRRGKIQTATISVYTSNENQNKLVLEGYIRASQSTQKIEVVLNQLRLGLELGGVTAVILASFSSIYLATETIKPMTKGIQRLRRITSDVSHQVRTPLTRITIATEILLNQTSKSQISQAKKLNIINAAAEQIKRLLEELLFLIRLDASPNVRELGLSHIPAIEILQTLREQFEPIAQAQGIELQTHLYGDFLIKGDRDKLNRLLANLLENAVKYTDAGGNIYLDIEHSKTEAIFSVRDTGIGISQQNLPFVFQDFWRGEAAKVKYRDGLGLGLAIAEAITQQHQGQITVSSEEGVGSCFQVRIPFP